MANSFVYSGSNPYGNVLLSDLVGGANPESGLYKIFNDVDNLGENFANAELAVAATVTDAGDYMAGSSELAAANLAIQSMGDGGLLVGNTSVDGLVTSLTVDGAAEGYVLSITAFTPTPTLGWVPAPSSNGVWSRVLGTSQTLLNGHSYVATNVAQTEFNLPATASLGETYRIVATTAAGFTVQLGSSGQRIRFGNQITTALTGELSSTAIGDVVTISCIDATTPESEIFIVTSSIGNLKVS